MGENVRALVVVLVLSIPVLRFLRPQLTANATTLSDFNVRAGLWVALTLALFLSHNFWLFVLIVAVALLTVGRKDSNPLGLYFFLLLLAPPFQSTIQGFGGINYFLAIDYLRVLSLVILLPLALSMLSDPARARLFGLPTDKYLLAYLGLQLVIQAPTTTTTDTMRWLVAQFIDVYLPYYAFSRGLSDLSRLRDALASFVAGASLLAVIALFESAKGWLLYSSLANVMDVNWGFGGYMFRNGSLRATASLGHSIIFGYVMVVALGLHLSLRSAYATTRAWKIVLVLLSAGIVASMSRGPWVGAAAVVAIALAMSPGAGAKLGKFGVAAICIVPLVMMTPLGARIVAVMPFIGNVDAGSVEYRQQLFNVSWNVLMMNPIFGSPYYMASESMQQLREGGGGIIDMVNSYLGIAMFSGFAGLALFGGVFASGAARMYFHLARHPARGSENFSTGLALLATLVGVLVTIATVSSIDAVPVIYWCLAGACAAYLHLGTGERVALPAELSTPDPSPVRSRGAF